MKRLMKVLPICAAALLFSAAAPGIAAADHGRHGGYGKGQHHVVKHHKAAKHSRHDGYRQTHHGYGRGHGYGHRRHFGHARRHFRPARRHRGYRVPYYVYAPYFAYWGHRH